MSSKSIFRRSEKQLESKRLHLENLEDRMLLAVVSGWSCDAPALTSSPEATGGEVVVDGLTQSALVAAINRAAAGDTIVFAQSGTIALSSAITISKSITIDGDGGVTLDAQNSTAIFNRTADVNFTVKNLVLANASGGAINSADTANNALMTITVDNCTFRNNTSGRGGAISANGATVNVVNSTFTGNTASTFGGAIFVDGSAFSISGSTFTNNSITNNQGRYDYQNACGGAIFATNVVVASSIADSTFSGNTVSGYCQADGGAVYIKGLTDSGVAVSVSGCEFANNAVTAYGDGLNYRPDKAYGGAFWGGDAVFTLTDCSFSVNNSITDGYSNKDSYAKGGAAMFMDSTAFFDGCQFGNNAAFNKGVKNEYIDGGENAGGAVAGRVADLYFDGCTLTGNSVSYRVGICDVPKLYGGAVYVYSGSIHLYNSELTGNSLWVNLTDADQDGPRMRGAAVYDEASSEENVLDICNCTITANTMGGVDTVGKTDKKTYGGALYIAGNATVTQTLIADNIYYATSNTKRLYGGGVCIDPSMGDRSVVFTNCTITGNKVLGLNGFNPGDGRGAGIYDEAAASTIVTLNGCIIIGNGLSDGGSNFTKYDFRNQNKDNSAFILNNCVFDSSADGSYRTANDCFDINGYVGDIFAADYTLAEGSPAIDLTAYTEVLGPDGAPLANDLRGEGFARFCGVSVDAGCYEFQSSSPAGQLDAPQILNDTRSLYISFGANRQCLQWSEVENASAYCVAYSSDGETWNTVETTDTRYVFTGLTYGADMQYKVQALGDGSSYTDSDYSAVAEFNVCPMDINGDGEIAGADRALLAKSWMAEEGDDEYFEYADINADGEIAAMDRTYLANNWMSEAGDEDLVYPRPAAADAAFADFLSTGIDVDLNEF